VKPVLAFVLFLLAACARIMPPPGGPEDRLPPRLSGTRPDSIKSIPDFEGDVEFQFSEVISENDQPNFGTGTGGLEKLVVVSPANEVPVVKWKRDRITVHPREGWQPNTVYRVELLAGVRDLRNNESKASSVITFTTGAPVPTDSLIGRVVDWATQRPVPFALVEAVLEPDSLAYRTAADSTGRFRFGPLPRGSYLVYGVLDVNRNNRREPREAFDSIRVAAARDSVGELWAFKHDSTGPRIQTIIRNDSLSATITFVHAMDPAIRQIPGDSIRVRLLPDSTPMAVEALVTQQLYDSLYKPKPPKSPKDSLAADSLRARGDTAAAPPDTAGVPPDTAGARRDTVPPRIPGIPRQVGGARRRQGEAASRDLEPLKTKPPLFDKMILRMVDPLRDGAKYVVEVSGVKTVSGVIGGARITLVIEVPKKPETKPDSLKTKPDSLNTKPDSLNTKPDSLKAPPDSVPP
jgi:hypothetical protein